MPQNPTLCTWRLTRFAVTLSIAVVMFLAGPGLMTAQGQVPVGFANPYSPFVTIPWFQGEVRVTPILIGIDSGKNTLPALQTALQKSWDLRHTFNMNKSYVFADVMVRVQVGPLSFRMHGEERNFVGIAKTIYPGATGATAESRLEFSGYRTGLDLDILSRGGVRAGVNADYYWYFPIFNEAVVTVPHPGIGRDKQPVDVTGKRILGGIPVTLGVHAAYTVPRQILGAWPVFEARVRWPVKLYSVSAEITDLEFAAGLRGPGTVLGGLAVRGGYRRTSISFTDSQIYGANASQTQSNLDAVLSGWFGELVYYY